MINDQNTDESRKKISQKHKPLIAQYLCHVFNTMSDGLYITDKNGETLAINTMYENLTGLRSENLLGVNVSRLVDDGTFDIALNRQVVETGKSATAVQINRKGRKVILTAHPIFDYDDDVALVVTFVRDIALISQLKEQVASQRQLIEKYRDEITSSGEKIDLIAESKPMKALLHKLRRVAGTDATVLFLGETGVGKDVMSRKLHELSLRSKQPFLKVDCTSIPENLIESELFGYVPGAFSGAHSKGKMGLFEMANRGTLFLDEIGELPLPMQGKLLRVLQDGEIQRVGDTKAKKVDVRIIAATNRDLEQEMEAGRFRSDLFYRLRVAVATIPPLRERAEDILPMIHHFLNKFYTKYKRMVGLSSMTEEIMVHYHWPGNIRELENLIHSLMVTCEDGLIQPEDLPRAMLSRIKPAKSRNGFNFQLAKYENKNLKEIMAEMEKELLINALEMYGSIPKVAEAFSVNRTTIFRKMKKFKIL
ncbi:MAG: sigma 54-interacting transcriptional regulator [Desulfobacterales bacterium]|nr:sigma 54-interacting transcriptional regulator [Desulfobacterales bacterium]